LVGLLLPSTALFASLQFGYLHNALVDISFWTPVIGCLATAVAFAIHHYEHKRSMVPSGVLLFYWPLYIVVNGLKLHSLTIRGDQGNNNVSFILLAICEAAAVAVFFLEYMIPKARSEYQTLEDDEQKCPMEDSDIFSILTFGWMTPLMKAGYKKFLTEDDLWNVRRKDTTQYTEEQFTNAWQKELKKPKPNLWLALAQAFGGPYVKGALYKVIQDVLNYSQPQLLRYLIAFVSSYKTDKPQPVSTGLAIAGIMFIASVVQTVTLHQYFQHAFEVGMRIRSALTAAIYKKSMRLSNEGRASKSTGDIVNLQAVDTQRLQGRREEGQQESPLITRLTLKLQTSRPMVNRFGVHRSR